MKGAAEARLDLAALGLERGADVLVKRALGALPPGERLAVFGSDGTLGTHLAAWARARGHAFRAADPREVLAAGTADSGARLVGHVERGSTATSRLVGATRAGEGPDDVVDEPSGKWGLAARGALVEDGAPDFCFQLARKDAVWADEAANLYAQALASQWDPAKAIPWDAPRTHPDEVEDALVQVLTYLVENETAALIVPARFAAQVHPHFREIQQLLAIQAADEARHIEVFTRRARLFGGTLGLSTVGGQESLRTVVEEPDFEIASLLLSVLGEGTFVNLLWFLHRFAPDECTRAMMKLSAQDEARHVAFGVAHLARHAKLDPTLLDRMATAIEQRHATLENTAGLNEEVFDALVVIAAGSLSPERIGAGHAEVASLAATMHKGRLQRLGILGFDQARAEALSALHTRNFM